MTARISDNFLDPVSLTPLEDPVIDQCGHYFNKSTVKELVNQYGSTKFPCPFSRQIVDSDEFKEFKEIGRCVREITKQESEENLHTDLLKKMDAMSSLVLASLEGMSSMRRDMTVMIAKNNHYNMKNFILNKKIMNAVSASAKDHFISIFSSKRMEKVMNRGITAKERKLLSIPDDIIVLENEISSSKSEGDCCDE